MFVGVSHARDPSPGGAQWAPAHKHILHTYTLTHTHTHTHRHCTHIRTDARTHGRTHAHTRARAHTHTHKWHTHTHTHTHKHRSRTRSHTHAAEATSGPRGRPRSARRCRCSPRSALSTSGACAYPMRAARAATQPAWLRAPQSLPPAELPGTSGSDRLRGPGPVLFRALSFALAHSPYLGSIPFFLAICRNEEKFGAFFKVRLILSLNHTTIANRDNKIGPDGSACIATSLALLTRLESVDIRSPPVAPYSPLSSLS